MRQPTNVGRMLQPVCVALPRATLYTLLAALAPPTTLTLSHYSCSMPQAPILPRSHPRCSHSRDSRCSACFCVPVFVKHIYATESVLSLSLSPPPLPLPFSLSAILLALSHLRDILWGRDPTRSLSLTTFRHWQNGCTDNWEGWNRKYGGYINYTIFFRLLFFTFRPVTRSLSCNHFFLLNYSYMYCFITQRLFDGTIEDFFNN